MTTNDELNLSMKEYDKINNILNANNNKNNKKENNDKINKNSVSSNVDNILPNNNNYDNNNYDNNNYDNNQFLEFKNDVSIQNELDDFLSKLNSN